MPAKRKKAKRRPAKRKHRKNSKWPWIVLLFGAIVIAGLLISYRPWDFLKPTSGRPIETHAELQIALARAGFSPGSVDGIKGGQTRQALQAYQIAQNLEPSGQFDEATRQLRL